MGKDDIEFVAARGVFSGTDQMTFSPNSAMTRGMCVTVLGRLAEIDTSNYKNGQFSDVKADAYYAPFVNWAASMVAFMTSYAKTMGYTLPKTHTDVTFADHTSIANWAAKLFITKAA